MDRLIQLIQQYPFLLLVLVAWIGGAIANAVKAAKAAKERARQAMRRETDRRVETKTQKTQWEPTATEPDDTETRQEEGARSAEDVAAEMRRILGMEGPLPRSARRSPELRTAEPSPLPMSPARAPRPVRPTVTKHRDVVEPERAPRAVQPTTQSRALDLHVDPHVGDAIKGRQLSGGRNTFGKSRDLGSLGGRVHDGPAMHRRDAVRFSLDDLKKAMVLNEILGPPLALRGPEERLR